ncbi:MAG: hydrogenase/urease maturation nickel metallochaperone HypA [Candidatus Diapherotrites archaeon]|nr:hydrogenase/urease maturation nickel metallochaperone HypA [Candidatus Diapherotrites archaeon]
MHEYSLAQAVLNSVEEFISRNKAKGKVIVKISFGELQHLGAEQFKDILQKAARERRIKAEFFVENELASFRCFSCHNEWENEKKQYIVKSHSHEEDSLCHEHEHHELVEDVRCPRCGSDDIEIIKGIDVKIKEIIIDTKKARSE